LSQQSKSELRKVEERIRANLQISFVLDLRLLQPKLNNKYNKKASQQHSKK